MINSILTESVKKRMKLLQKMLMVAVFATLLAGLSITASYADCIPGCDCVNMVNVMTNRAQAIRVRDRAYAQELTKQPDNSVGMTCLDHGLALTSRLGQLFSDKVPVGMLSGNNTKVFGTSTYPGFGADQLLATALRVTVNDSQSNHALQFPDSLSRIIGATVLNFFATTFMGSINAVISQIQSYMSTLQTYVTTFNNLVTALQTIITMLNGSTPTWILALVTSINLAWTAITTFVNNMIMLVQTIMGLITTISGIIMGALGSLTGFNGPTGECSRIQQLWGNQQPAIFLNGPIRALTGTSIETGTQYMNFRQLLGNAPKPAGMTAAAAGLLLGELGNATNAPFLANALTDIQGGGMLSAPGVMPTWKMPTVFAPGTTSAAIIGAM